MECGVVLICNSPLAQLEKDEHIEEVHAAENEDDSADFQAEDFHDLAALNGRFPDFKRVHGVADVDEVEADEQEVVDGLCQLFITVEDVNEEKLAVAEKGMGYPNGEQGSNGQIDAVQQDDEVHD